MIVQVSVVLRKTIGGSDWRFDSFSGGHLQSQKLLTFSRESLLIRNLKPSLTANIGSAPLFLL